MWVNLGEPSIGIFSPYFPLSKKVPLYAWADELPENSNGQIINENSSSVMNNLIVNIGELSAYENNKVTLGPLGITILDPIDRTVDYEKVVEIQNLIFSTEDINNRKRQRNF